MTWWVEDLIVAALSLGASVLIIRAMLKREEKGQGQ